MRNLVSLSLSLPPPPASIPPSLFLPFSTSLISPSAVITPFGGPARALATQVILLHSFGRRHACLRAQSYPPVHDQRCPSARSDIPKPQQQPSACGIHRFPQAAQRQADHLRARRHVAEVIPRQGRESGLHFATACDKEVDGDIIVFLLPILIRSCVPVFYIHHMPQMPWRKASASQRSIIKSEKCEHYERRIT